LFYTTRTIGYPLYNPLIPDSFQRDIKVLIKLDSLISLVFDVWQANLVLATSNGNVIVIELNPVRTPHRKV
jgi:hypothetical protein